LHPLII